MSNTTPTFIAIADLSTEPKWLREEICNLASCGCIYSTAVAVSLFVRLTSPGVSLEELLKGNDPKKTLAMEWIRGFAPEALDDLQRLADAELYSMYFRLQEIEDGLHGCQHSAELLLEARDGLHGVYVLLTEVGKGQKLGTEIHRLDLRLKEHFRSTPIHLSLTSERLGHVRGTQGPDQWWADPFSSGF